MKFNKYQHLPIHDDITIITAVDALYIHKFLSVFRTWATLKPETQWMRLFVMFDESQLKIDGPELERVRRECGGRPHLKLIPWSMPDATSQREKMLTSLTVGAAKYVKTPWYLKIDADTVATAEGQWIKPEWFEPVNGVLPAFISNPWKYTKPAEMAMKLQEWGDNVDALKSCPRLKMSISDDGRRAYYDRIISWLFFGNTQWTREAVELCGGEKLPVPSQDTYLHYVAARSGRRYVTASFKKMGWGHMGRTENAEIERKCKELLQ